MGRCAVQASQRFCLETEIAHFLITFSALHFLQFLHDFGLDKTFDEIFVFLLVKESVDRFLGELKRFIADILRFRLGDWF